MKIRDFYRNKVVVVYGASGGLGEAICAELYGIVAQLILAGRNAEKLQAVKQQLESHCEGSYQQVKQRGKQEEKTVLQIWAFSSEHAADMAAFATRVKNSGADGLIIATGKTLYQSFYDQRENITEAWPPYEELLYINVASIFQLAIALLPYFRQQQGFFHIAGSYACLFPVPYQAVYSASKTALLSFVQAVTKELEAEFGPKNVRGLLNISLIGGMATNMYYQSGLQKQFATLEKLVIASPQKVAVGLLQGIASRKKVITIKWRGFLVYHFVRRLPTSWVSYALLRAYRPKK